MSLDSLAAIFVSLALYEMMAAAGPGAAVRDASAIPRVGSMIARADRAACGY